MSDYYLGLDMGTSSVGWAVTDENYRLLRGKGKDLWGSRLFDEAQSAAERRTNRISRRRRERQVARIAFLKEVFAEEISKVDPGFYARLGESKYHFEDRSEDNKQKYALFNDRSFSDAEYYEKYPTIFHLRKELLESSEVHDIRLVFLALLNMYKRRGNFLNSSIDTQSENGSLTDAFQALVEEAAVYDFELKDDIDINEFVAILGDRGLSKSARCEKISVLLNITKKNKPQYALLLMICGLNGKLRDIYGEQIVDDDHKALSICFRDSRFEEKEAEVREYIGDEYYSLIEAAKAIHDIGLLIGIKGDYSYLTQARVALYEKHKEDLQLLKHVLNKYDKSEYNRFFRTMSEGNYSGYVGSVNSDKVKARRGSKTSAEDLYKNIKKILEKAPCEDEDVQRILSSIENESFLPKQLTSDNGVIPNQEYVREMRRILKNAENYLTFLGETDETGLSISEKIIQVFSYHMPYYVGPIGQEHLDEKGYNVWARRIQPGKVYPWNLSEKIDVAEAAEKFISRMVRHCTYISEEATLPKNSLLYEKFMVLNEINNIKIRGELLSVELKQELYNSLFLPGKKVSMKRLRDFFIVRGLVGKDEEDFISGIDTEEGIKSSLSSRGKFFAILGEDINKESCQDMVERIIFWGTIYGNDKKFLKEKIVEAYSSKLSEDAIKRILGFKFEGWGNLSKEFLMLSGMSKKDGNESTLIGALWNTNDNLMQLLSDDYTYRKALEEKTVSIEKKLCEWTIEDLDGMYLSAPVKRMVWQTLAITKELEQVIGDGPSRIFVEMPREDGEKGVRTTSRKKKLLDLYAHLKGSEKEWKKDIDARQEADFRIKKLYLYYVQMGRCMYSGEPIDLEKLLGDNTAYDIDHIYPRHFTKDDSIENNLVLVKKQINNSKQDNYPLPREIQTKMTAFWRELHKGGFISKEKFERLIRTHGFTPEERAAFVSRQLVETRQGTKAITQILHQAYPNAQIIFSKAGNVSDFRKKFDLPKVRCVNDLHHAKDAYLNIVVGNTYFSKFTANPLNYMREAEKNSYSNGYEYHMDKLFERDVCIGEKMIWKASDSGEHTSGTIALVKKTMARNTPIITRKAYLAHGGITRKDTLYSKDLAKEGAYIPATTSDVRLQDVTKYGGRRDVANRCYALVSYKVGGKKVLALEAMPIFLGDIDSISEKKILDYLYSSLRIENGAKEVSDIRILIRKIRYGTKIRIDGYEYWIGGKTEKSIYLDNACHLELSSRDEAYIAKICKAVDKDYYEEKDKDGSFVLSTEENRKLYVLIRCKLQSALFCNRKNTISELICQKEELFTELSLKEQCKILIEIVKWFDFRVRGVDLKMLGGSTLTGTCRINKKIGDLEEATLIYESSSGLYSKEVDLLNL